MKLNKYCFYQVKLLLVTQTLSKPLTAGTSAMFCSFNTLYSCL